MYVVEGAAQRLRESERKRFLSEDWPIVRARIERLGLDPRELVEQV